MAVDMQDDGSGIWCPAKIVSRSAGTVGVRYTDGDLRGRYAEFDHDDKFLVKTEDDRWEFVPLPNFPLSAQLWHRVPTARQRQFVTSGDGSDHTPPSLARGGS